MVPPPFRAGCQPVSVAPPPPGALRVLLAVAPLSVYATPVPRSELFQLTIEVLDFAFAPPPTCPCALSAQLFTCDLLASPAPGTLGGTQAPAVTSWAWW